MDKRAVFRRHRRELTGIVDLVPSSRRAIAHVGSPPWRPPPADEQIGQHPRRRRLRHFVQQMAVPSPPVEAGKKPGRPNFHRPRRRGHSSSNRGYLSAPIFRQPARSRWKRCLEERPYILIHVAENLERPRTWSPVPSRGEGRHRPASRLPHHLPESKGGSPGNAWVNQQSMRGTFRILPSVKAPARGNRSQSICMNKIAMPWSRQGRSCRKTWGSSRERVSPPSDPGGRAKKIVVDKTQHH